MPSHSIIIYTTLRRLDLFEGNLFIRKYPIGVGNGATPTPHGRFTITSQIVNPGGIFGSRWMGFSIPHYGIHGTNNPSSIGQALSKGCIRMHNRDVENLYQYVKIGTPVLIQP